MEHKRQDGDVGPASCEAGSLDGSGTTDASPTARRTPKGPRRSKISTRNLKAGVIAAVAGAGAFGLEVGVAHAATWIVIGNYYPGGNVCESPGTTGAQTKSYSTSYLGAFVSASDRCHGATGDEAGYVKAYLRHNSEGQGAWEVQSGLGSANTGAWDVGAGNDANSGVAKLRSANVNAYWHKTVGVVYSGSGTVHV